MYRVQGVRGASHNRNILFILVVIVVIVTDVVIVISAVMVVKVVMVVITVIVVNRTNISQREVYRGYCRDPFLHPLY